MAVDATDDPAPFVWISEVPVSLMSRRGIRAAFENLEHFPHSITVATWFFFILNMSPLSW